MSLRKDIDLTKPRNLGAAEKALGKSLVRAHVNKALERAARQSTPVLAARTWDAPPAKPGGSVRGAHASGALVKAWEIIPDRPSMSIAILNKKIYSPYVEGGVPGSAPKIPLSPFVLDMFEKWMRDRGILPKDPSMRPRSLARAIIWSINKRIGVRFVGRKVIERSTARISEIFARNLREEMQRALEQARNT